jgi:hypothetical protein
MSFDEMSSYCAIFWKTNKKKQKKWIEKSFCSFCSVEESFFLNSKKPKKQTISFVVLAHKQTIRKSYSQKSQMRKKKSCFCRTTRTCLPIPTKKDQELCFSTFLFVSYLGKKS